MTPPTQHPPQTCERQITATRFGRPEVLLIDDITAMRWEAPKLTLLIVENILMDFNGPDARQCFNELQRFGIPIDHRLGSAR
ncbi:MAG: hypothetical protein R3F19_01480 [Verrucomicrobiales bacterium]